VIKQIRIVLDDHHWPKLRCTVADSSGETARESVYDTAIANFELMATNALRAAIRDIVHLRKHPVLPAPPWVPFKAQPVPKPKRKKKGARRV
jgi:hypothetical protein